MYRTARSYLLAGFTAASIVAAVPLAPRPTVNLPKIQSADVRLAAAESEIASTVRKFRAVEARALASIVDPTTVGPAHQSEAAKHVAITTSAGTIVPSDLIPLIGDVAAFNFDLLGTPFALITALSFAGDLAISDLSSGMLQDILGDVSNSLRFGIGSRISLLTADIVVLTNEVNHLAEIINPAPPSGTQSGVSTSVDRTAPSRTPTATFDPAATGSFIGDAVLLGLDVTATPFELTESLTNALSAAALDLGAGQVQDARQDFATNLRLGFVEARTRLDNDLNGIATSVARLRGTSGTTAGQAGAASSVGASNTSLVGAKTAASSSAAQAFSAPAAKPLSTDRRHTTAHNPEAIDAATTHPATASEQAPRHATKTARVPTRQGGDTAADTKPVTGSHTRSSEGAHGTNTSKHSAPGKQHTNGPKRRKQ